MNESEERIVSYTAEELDEMIARGEDLTDWDRVTSMTDEDIERNALEDYAENGEPNWDGPVWIGAPPNMGIPKYRVDAFIDEDIFAWLREQEGNFHVLLNEALRQYMQHHEPGSSSEG